MENPTDIYPYEVVNLENTIKSLKETLTLKEEHIQRITQRDYQTAAKLSGIREDVKAYLLDNYEDIGEDHCAEIAKLLGVELEQTIEVEVNVTHTITVTLPAGKEFDEDDLTFDVDTSGSYLDIESHDYDIIYCNTNQS